MKVKNSYIFFQIIIVISAILLLGVVYHYKEEKVSQELNNQLNLNKVYYQETYNNYKRLANNVHQFIFNNQKNLEIFAKAYKSKNKKELAEIREELFKQLNSGYAQLTTVGFRQIHYHLPNNHSFLRMHKPDKFGDNLTDIRYTVKTANETLKPIDGFEEGRVVNGFRFMFPLFNSLGEHIGSAESSVSSFSFIKHIEETYLSEVHFIIKKDVVEEKLWKEELTKHYKNSLESDDYYSERSSLKNHLLNHELRINYKELKTVIDNNLKKEEAFILHVNKSVLISFLPIKNVKDQKVVAFFVIYDENYELEEAENIFLITLVVIPIIAVILMILVKREHQVRVHLEIVNKNLTRRVDVEVAKSKQHDLKLMEQARFVQMGEMLSMIAHQWRQPLGSISATVINLRMRMELENYNLKDEKDATRCKEELYISLKEIDKFVKNLSETIDDFRNFYKPNKSYRVKNIIEPINSSLNIIKKSMGAIGIEVIIQGKSQKTLKIHINELMQVFLNIFKNATDNFKEHRVDNPQVVVTLKDQDEFVVVTIEDNGGGVPEDIISKVFDPYFTTKDEKNGTGLGLYMSKIIIEEHHQGSITVKNSDKGALFIIKIKEHKD